MKLFFFIAFVVVLLYVLLIISYIWGWFLNIKKNKFFSGIDVSYPAKNIIASVLVSCRNEEENLPNLLTLLLSQNFDANYEVIVINDHSTDKTESILIDFAKKNEHLKFFSLKTAQGKKQAIALGIEKASADFIVVTDADCTMGTNWLSGHYVAYQQSKAQLISAPVLLKGTTFFGKLQELEFLSLIASGAGSIGINRGIMCNGANLAFTKHLAKNQDSMKFSEISGDDVFLLQTAKKQYPKKVIFVPLLELAVTTPAEKTFAGFMNQRMRWASKSASYTDSDMILASWLVFFANLLVLFFFVLSVFFYEYWLFFFLLFVLKFSIDFLFLAIVATYFHKKSLLSYFFVLSAVYPFYIVWVAILSQWVGFSWKKRHYK